MPLSGLSASVEDLEEEEDDAKTGSENTAYDIHTGSSKASFSLGAPGSHCAADKRAVLVQD